MTTWEGYEVDVLDWLCDEYYTVEPAAFDDSDTLDLAVWWLDLGSGD